MMRSHNDTGALFLTAVCSCALALALLLTVGWCSVRADDDEGPDFRMIQRHMQRGCSPASDTHVEFKDSDHKVSVPRPVAPERAAEAVQMFNDLPPAGHVKFDEAWLADIDDNTGFLMVGTHGMVCALIQIPEDKWKPLLLVLDGQGT